MKIDLLLYFPASAALNAVTSLILGFFLLLKNFSSRNSRYFFYLCISAAFWSIGYVFWQISDNAVSALFWCRTLMIGAILVSLSYFHFVVVYLELDKEKKYKYVLYLFYILAIVWIIADLSGTAFVSTVVARSLFKFWPLPGPFFGPFLATFGIQVILASYLLWRAYRHSVGIDHKRHLLLLIGLFFAFVGGSTNYFLWYNIPIPPYGNAFVSLYVILTAYAVLKYHFLDLKVIAAEVLTVLILLVFLANIFIAQGTPALVFSIFGFLVVMIFSILLLRSVLNEVRHGEQMQKLAQDLEVANTQLRSLDEAKSTFVSIVSHQLRTPIAGVKGYLAMLADGDFGKMTAKQEEIVRMNLENIERLVRLIEIFLDISRIEAGRLQINREELHIDKMVYNVVSELLPVAQQKNLILAAELPPKLPVVFADITRIHNVLLNLVDNAIKYTEEGKVTVRVRTTPREVIFDVVDTGCGVKQGEGAALFRKFVRGDVMTINPNGAGLGLFIVKELVEAHGGQVWLDSRGEGQGSTFSFSLPFAQNNAPGMAIVPSHQVVPEILSSR